MTARAERLDAAGEALLARALREARHVELTTRRAVRGTVAGGHRSSARGAGIEFEEAREYVPGDDPRAVDQNVTARFGAPYVKVYREERELTVRLLVDVSSAARAGGLGPLPYREAAARFVACVALSAARDDDEVGLECFGDDDADDAGRIAMVDARGRVRARKGRAHALRVLRAACAALTRPPDEERRERATPRSSERRWRGLVAALDRSAGRSSGPGLERPALVFVLSDWLLSRRAFDVDATDLELALAHAARRHEVVAVRFDRRELELPDRRAGVVRLAVGDGRTTLVDWGSTSVRAAWRTRVAAWRARLDALWSRTGVTPLVIPAGPSVVADGSRSTNDAEGVVARALRGHVAGVRAGRNPRRVAEGST